MPPRLRLPDVTLCCVDTRDPVQAVYALRQSMGQADFARVLFLGPADQPMAGLNLQGIDYVSIPQIKSIGEYSRFILNELVGYVNTSHVLITQWDGYVTHAQYWSEEFLRVDYVGPPWFHRGQPEQVGNGGFSLRSKRLLEVVSRMQERTDEPEDMVICARLRPILEREHEIRFADLGLAQRFGIEYGDYRAAFGFHGMHNFAWELDEPELRAWLAQAPAHILRSQHARKLVKSLMEAGRWKAAADLIARRSAILGWTRDQQLLWLRATARRWLTRR